MRSLSITVIILTYNEELHIRRCIENVRQFAARVVLVDCFSTDKTAEIAVELGAEVVEHTWPGNQAEQFNWALDNLDISTEWILRLDADEYFTPELIEELRNIVPNMSKSISNLVFPLGRAFMGRILRHGIVNGVSMIRMFRKGQARYEKRLMDEHLQIICGETYTCKNKFVDDNRMSLHYFIAKHNNYSIREAVALIEAEYDINLVEADTELADVVKKKREQKAKYVKLPLFWRSFIYFTYRYVFKLGFLDGKEGFLWDFLQGWWYRTLVDAKIYEIKKACGNDREKIKEYLQKNYNVTL